MSATWYSRGEPRVAWHASAGLVRCAWPLLRQSRYGATSSLDSGSSLPAIASDACACLILTGCRRLLTAACCLPPPAHIPMAAYYLPPTLGHLLQLLAAYCLTSTIGRRIWATMSASFWPLAARLVHRNWYRTLGNSRRPLPDTGRRLLAAHCWLGRPFLAGPPALDLSGPHQFVRGGAWSPWNAKFWTALESLRGHSRYLALNGPRLALSRALGHSVGQLWDWLGSPVEGGCPEAMRRPDRHSAAQDTAAPQSHSAVAAHRLPRSRVRCP